MHFIIHYSLFTIHYLGVPPRFARGRACSGVRFASVLASLVPPSAPSTSLMQGRLKAMANGKGAVSYQLSAFSFVLC